MRWNERLLGGTRGLVLARLRRTKQSINELAAALGITDNAVRVHVAGLQRDGLVETAGLERGTGGKPAQLYRMTREAEELFPKAYSLVLSELLEVLEERYGGDEVVSALLAVGVRAAAAQRIGSGDPEARVEAAAEVLRALGAELEVERSEEGWVLRGYACPLSAVVAQHPRVCVLAQALVAEMTGQPVLEACERGERPRCALRVVR